MNFLSQYKGLRRELYILLVGRMMTNLGSMVWPMFTLILSRKLGFDATTIALCMMAYSIVSLPLALIGGRLADRYNKRNIIVFCDLVSISAFVYCSLVPITITSILVFSIASLFQAVEWPSYDALVADFSTSENREKAYSLSYLGGNLGFVLAPTIGGILFNNYLNLSFLINGISIALSTALIFFGIKDVHREHSEQSQGSYEQEIDTGASALKWLRGCRVALIFVIISALTESVYSMYNYLMPLDMTAIYAERGSLLYGTMSSLNCIVVLVSTALVTSLFAKMRETGKIMTGESLILCGFAVFLVFAKIPVMCYVAIVIFTWGEIFGAISQSPFITRRIPASHRGRISSIRQVLCSLTAALVQLGAGFVYDNLGSRAAWMCILGLSAISILLIAIMSSWDRKDFKAFYK